MIRSGLCILLTAFFASAATAQTMIPKLDQEGRKGDVARQARQKALDRFNAADKDKDGRLSPQEVEQDSAYLAEKFSERDTNHDGFLSWEEYVGHNRWEK
jgi:Ca2+-binding EF-hand superfamily protein